MPGGGVKRARKKKDPGFQFQKPKVLEGAIEKEILYRLVFEGHKAWKNPTRGKWNPKFGRFSKGDYGEIRGASDLICVWKDISPWVTFIEVKTPEEHEYLLRHYQKLWVGLNLTTERQVRMHFQIVFVEEVRSLGGSAIFASKWDHVTLEKERLKSMTLQKA